ncbi:unnamed protein product [Boreogadus saida]
MDSRETFLSGAAIRWRALRSVEQGLQQIRDMQSESFASQCCSIVEGQPGLHSEQSDMEEIGNEMMMEENIVVGTSHFDQQSFRMDLPEEESDSDQDADGTDQSCNLFESLRNWALTFGVSLSPSFYVVVVHVNFFLYIMFCVVQYLDAKKSVSAVPQSWYNDGVTLWPNYKSDERINRAVKFTEVPGQDWLRHPVRLLKIYGDFKSAWKGMKQSLTCDTSELDSDEENEAGGRGKRPAKPIHHYGDTESDREPVSNKPPTPSPQHRPSSRPLLRCNQPAPGPSYFAQPPLPPPPVPSSFSLPPPLSPSGPPFFSSPPQQLFSHQSNNYADPSLRHPPPPRMSSEATEVFMPSLNMGRSGKEPIICTPAELHMLTVMENMKQQINQLSMMMGVLMARSGAGAEPVEMTTEISFPLASLDEVESFELCFLKNPANTPKKQHMVGMLDSIGGRDTKHLIFNILAHIFADCVAKSINWKGVNTKKKFSEMATKAILARAVGKSRVGEKATDTEINHHTIRWFNPACDRGGDRRARAHPATVGS